MNEALQTYRREMQQELDNILGWWVKYAVDERQGGFHGRIDNDNTINEEAPKGAVLNSRILWTFSAAYNLTGNLLFLANAERSYQYLINYFVDGEYGGVYWSVDYKGQPLDARKQTYAIAFAVYGLSEYALAAKSEDALQQAKELYKSIVDYTLDTNKGGYIEAFTQDWKEIGDLRLSAKDFNEKKTMNTHLHVLEAFANLYRAWPDALLKQRIEDVIHLFLTKITDPITSHLRLFFDEDWNSKSDIASYGHDIEAAWLVQESAERIGNELLIAEAKKMAVKMSIASEEGLDKDGGLWYEREGGHLIKEKHWWPQAEAMVGFYNAYQITGDEHFLNRSLNSWRFTQTHLLNKKDGEWFWGITGDNAIMTGEDKAGQWKCPYHNGRACIELVRRIRAAD